MGEESRSLSLIREKKTINAEGRILVLYPIARCGKMRYNSSGVTEALLEQRCSVDQEHDRVAQW